MPRAAKKAEEPAPDPVIDESAPGEPDGAATVRDRVLGELITYRRENGTVPTRMVTEAAGRCGVSVRTMRRWLVPPPDEAPDPSAAFTLTQQHLEAIAGHNGNVKRAHADLVAGGHELPSYMTFWRAWRTQPTGLRAYLKDGADAMKAKWIYAPYTAESRNAVWQADHFELPVDVIPTGHTTTTVKPWLTMFEDDKTRMIMSWAIVAVPGRRIGADVVAATIVSAIAPHDVGGVQVGGVPGSIRWDQAAEFKAGMVTQLALRVGFDAHAVPPYSGHMKGKIERAGQTAQAEVASLATGYTHGATTMRHNQPFRDEPITEALLVARFGAWVEHYNTTRAHSSLGGRTPLEVWQADPTPLRLVDHDLLRDSFLIEPKERKVGKKGVFFRNQWWLGLGLLDHVDRKVEVRYPIGDDTFIEIYLKGAWLCTAERAEDLSPSARRELGRLRQSQYREARQIQDGARRSRSAANRATTPAHPSLAPLSTYGTDDGLNADPDALWELLAANDEDDGPAATPPAKKATAKKAPAKKKAPTPTPAKKAAAKKPAKAAAAKPVPRRRTPKEPS
jgi:putative transposase